MKNIKVEKDKFIDQDGRQMILRGLNVAGSSKVPYDPCIPTHKTENFFDTDVSFVGRPFPLDQADEHFTRLKSWGFQFLRLQVIWEAIEHAGPGQYDQEYIEYIYQICQKAAEYEINLFIDPHQDVWSRFTGGDGAPLWTLDKVGFNVKNLHSSGAAILHNFYGDPFPLMIWPTNYTKLACATMFTLFFAGNDFAPGLKIDGTPVQDYLQSHYINAILQLAEKLKDLPNVVGFDTLNEPSKGWIGVEDVDKVLPFLRRGASPTPFQSMLLGAGFTQEVQVYDFQGKDGKMMQNKDNIRAWKENTAGIWREQGVWDIINGEPKLLKPDYFNQVNGSEVNFKHDYLKPFLVKFAESIQNVDSDYLIFLETNVENRKLPNWSKDDPANIINSDHWYDHSTLLTKQFAENEIFPHTEFDEKVVGKEAIEQTFLNEVLAIKKPADELLDGIPTIIGEFGIPYDLNDKKAYQTGDFTMQKKALDRSMRIMERARTGYCLWNYTPDNTNERGDQWNGEDLSIFSQDQQNNPEDINSGGRALETFIRPYPYKISGELIKYSFDMESCHFMLAFEDNKKINKPTKIFIPKYHYKDGFEVKMSDGEYDYQENEDILNYFPSEEKSEHKIEVFVGSDR